MSGCGPGCLGDKDFNCGTWSNKRCLVAALATAAFVADRQSSKMGTPTHALHICTLGGELPLESRSAVAYLPFEFDMAKIICVTFQFELFIKVP